MKSKFLDKAIQGTALDDALRVAEQLHKAKANMPYASGSKKDIGAGLRSFSKQVIKNKQLDKFVKLVNKYEEQVHNETEASNIDTFVNYYVSNRPEQVNMPGYTGGFKKIKKGAEYNKKEAESLYVQYWTSRIITEHNERVNIAEKLAKKYNESYYGQAIDIRMPVSRDGKIVGETIDIKQLQEATKYEGRLELRSKKATYKLPSNTSDEVRSSIVDNKNYDLTNFKNLKLLFLSNLMTALQKSHWDNTYEIASLLIRHGKLASVYNSYIKSNISVVFEYNESISEGNSDQEIFIDKLKKEVEKYAAKDKSIHDEAVAMGIIKDKEKEKKDQNKDNVDTNTTKEV